MPGPAQPHIEPEAERGARAPKSTGGVAALKAQRTPPADLNEREAMRAYYLTVRRDSEALAAPLAPEDMVVQTMPDVSPTKWHLAHTSWFFETFLLKPHAKNYRPLNETYDLLFNSYYQQVGPQWLRPHRGFLSRPTVAEVMDYRAYVDGAMLELMEEAGAALWQKLAVLITLGLNHEQQHQELICTDIKHVLAQNPLSPAPYAQPAQSTPAPALSWSEFGGGIYEIGRDMDPAGFSFDNEGPRHEILLRPFRLASRPVTNGEFRAFIEEGGYQRAPLWLSDGWNAVSEGGWQAPAYWRRADDGSWREFTLHGEVPLDENAPVTHISLYEAAAYAEWAGARLPLEAELEVAARGLPLEGNFLMPQRDGGAAPIIHPQAVNMSAASAAGDGPQQLFGDVWEWTASSYSAYPGYRAPSGAIGEYNGKFMCNQMVLRGGSCATPHGHMRATYRNFFPAAARWQFSGLRLASDL